MKDTIDNIILGKLDLDGGLWGNISNEGLNIIRGLLNTDPSERLSAYEAMNHTWLKMSAVNMVRNKFIASSGIFADSIEEDFRNMTITCKYHKSGKVDCDESDNHNEDCHENDETSHNFFYAYKNDMKNKSFQSTRSKSK